MAKEAKNIEQSVVTETPATIDTTKGGPTDTTTEQPSPRISYTDLYTSLTGDKYVDKDKIAEEEKKFKRNKLIASIGDGINALSNLFFTTRGAPNMYNPNNSTAQKIQARWDKWKADTDADNQAYIAGLMNARKMDDDYNDKMRNWRHTIDIFDRQQEWRNQDVEYRNEQAQQAQSNWQAQHNFQVEQAERAAEQWEQAFNETKRHNRASEATLYARASGGSGSKSSKKNYVVLTNSKGKSVYKIPQENWDSYYYHIYNAIVNEIKRVKRYDSKNNVHQQIAKIDIPNNPTPQEQEQFIHKYWGIMGNKLQEQFMNLSSSEVPEIYTPNESDTIEWVP